MFLGVECWHLGVGIVSGGLERGSRGVRKAGCSTRSSLVPGEWGQRVRKDHSGRSMTELGTQMEVDLGRREGEVKICPEATCFKAEVTCTFPGCAGRVGGWDKTINRAKEVWRQSLCDPLQKGERGRGSHSRWFAADLRVRVWIWGEWRERCRLAVSLPSSLAGGDCGFSGTQVCVYAFSWTWDSVTTVFCLKNISSLQSSASWAAQSKPHRKDSWHLSGISAR